MRKCPDDARGGQPVGDLRRVVDVFVVVDVDEAEMSGLAEGQADRQQQKDGDGRRQTIASLAHRTEKLLAKRPDGRLLERGQGLIAGVVRPACVLDEEDHHELA